MIDVLTPLIKQFLPFAKNRIGFQTPPRLFLKNDSDNAKNPLGKTAYYDPKERSVTLYISGRHPKDVMRSLSHELVHHAQCCRGDFENTTTEPGYAQKDDHMREMEREAYEIGNLCFRDWEDSIKSTIYFESLQKRGVKETMSTKNWRNRELNGLLMERFGFKFKTLEESLNNDNKVNQEELEESPSHPPEDRVQGRDAARRKKKPSGERIEEEEELEEITADDILYSKRDDKKRRKKEELEEMSADSGPPMGLGGRDDDIDEPEEGECGQHAEPGMGGESDVEGLAAAAMAAIHDLAIAAGADLATDVATGDDVEAEEDLEVITMAEEDEEEKYIREAVRRVLALTRMRKKNG